MKWQQSAGSVLALALLVALVVVPSSAPAVSPQPQDISSAYPLTSSPVTATVDATTAPDAVFSVSLNRGDQVTASVTATAGTDFDLRLYDMSATSLAQADHVLASSITATYPEGFTYTVPGGVTSGSYFLDVRAANGTGEAELAWSVRRATRLSLSADHHVVSYGGSANLTAQLTDSVFEPEAGQRVAIFQSRDGATWSYWKTVATDASGTTTVTVAPARKTFYKMRFSGNAALLGALDSESVSVAPRVALGEPAAPASMTCNKPYAVWGTLKPRQGKGARLVSVQVYHREGGKWVLNETVPTKSSNYSTYSRYTGMIALNAPGRWKLIAHCQAGSSYAESVSSPRYVAVPKQQVAGVSARVDDAHPHQYDSVIVSARVRDVYGKPIPGAKVVFAWHFKTGTHVVTDYADSAGVAWDIRYVGSAPVGYRVLVSVTASGGGGTAHGSTGFTPR